MSHEDNMAKQQEIDADARRPIIFRLNGHTWGAVNLLATFAVFVTILNWKWEVDRNFEELRAGTSLRWTSIHEQRAWSDCERLNAGFKIPDVERILRELPPAMILGSSIRQTGDRKWKLEE